MGRGPGTTRADLGHSGLPGRDLKAPKQKPTPLTPPSGASKHTWDHEGALELTHSSITGQGNQPGSHLSGGVALK